MNNNTENEFPQIKAETLSGKEVVFPDVVKGKIALIVIAFKRQTQREVETWAEAFLTEFGNDTNYVFYEIPMIGTSWKVIAPIIDRGMRSGVPKEKHDNVATYYGPLKEYYKKLGVDNPSLCYVFLLNKEGEIEWQAKGAAGDKERNELFNSAHALNK